MWTLRALVRITLLPQGSKLATQGTAKGMKMENVQRAKNINDFYVNFDRACQYHTFAARIQVGTPKEQPKEWKWKMSNGLKNISDFYVNFARACQDHTFAAGIQIGIPRDSQRNEHGKCLMGNKTQTSFIWILRAPARTTFSPQGSKLGSQGTDKRMKMQNLWQVKKHIRLFCEFCAHLSGSHFCRKDPSWNPKGQPKEWKWEMYDG